MDLHENFVFSKAATAVQQQPVRELSDRDRDALHRVFNDMRRAVAGTSHHQMAALPHP